MTDRANRLLAELTRGDSGAELLLVTSLVNVRYLTGFTGSSGIVIVGPDTRVFLSDFRYTEQAATEVAAGYDRRTASRGLDDELAGLLPEGEVRLGFEDDDVTVARHARLREHLPGRVELVRAGAPVERLRMVKEPEEIDRIRAASQLADAAVREIMEQGLAGRTEADVALALEDGMRRRGASAPSFDTIVAAGPHGALPHATPRDVEIGVGELVVIDWGAVLDGYCSDCTRTLATGEIPASAAAVYDTVREAQHAGLDAIRPGASGKATDSVARAVIEAAGHGDQFGHSLGHGVGLEVHERPTLSQRSDDVLAAGNVVSCEPGIYVPGEVGVRIEDLCVVTASGCEILTDIPKELIDVG